MDKIDINAVRNKLEETKKSLPPDIHPGNGVFVPLNLQGTQQPIFWCFNNWIEPLSLAHHLGPDQPLFGTRSFHGLLKGKSAKKANVVDLAEIYVDEILEYHHSGPIILGGNCQAAPIVEAVAHQLLIRGMAAPTLIIVEHQLRYHYPGYVLHLFGAESEQFNPFLQGNDPREDWQHQFAASAWGLIRTGHGQYFRNPAIQELCAYIRMVVAAFRDGVDLPTGEITVNLALEANSDVEGMQ